MSIPTVEIKTDASGRVTYSVTEEGVLLTKEQAERIASRIAGLEELVQGFHKVANYVCDHWDYCEYCEHGRYGENMREKCLLGKLNDQMEALGIMEVSGDDA